LPHTIRRTSNGGIWKEPQLAAITHGHSLGYMPAAVQVHIINRIIFPPEEKRAPLKEVILEARDTAEELFAGDEHLPELIEIIDRAVMLAEGDLEDDLDNIHQLGQGGVAEETLAIALYCALRHQDEDVILEIADDLCYGCPMTEYGAYRDPQWEMKYIRARRQERAMN